MNLMPKTNATGADDLSCPPASPREPIELRQRRQQSQQHLASSIQHERHVKLHPPPSGHISPANSIYRGSYGQGHSKSRLPLPPGTPSVPSTPRLSISSAHLADVVHDLDPELPHYGLEEHRDGFFDGTFQKPAEVDPELLVVAAKLTLPTVMQSGNPLSIRGFFPHLLSEIQNVVRQLISTRAGIKLTKSFLAFFVAYVLCLIAAVNEWLGRYSYFMVISAIFNHPGRTIGAQLDGTISTILGTATGLGWGAFALWISSSSTVAKSGYGGVLATFLIIFMGLIAFLRADSIRLYQFVLSAGISINYTCLAEVSTAVNWAKLFDYGIPWLFGQAISLVVCCTVFPDAGARPLAVSLHSSFEVMLDGLVTPQLDTLHLHRRLANTFVSLSVAYRDLVLDVSVTRFDPADVEHLRNLMQGVIRSLLSLKPQSELFHILDEVENNSTRISPAGSLSQRRVSKTMAFADCVNRSTERDPDVVINIDLERQPLNMKNTGRRAAILVAEKLAEPTSKILELCRIGLSRCDAVLMDISSYRKYLGPSKHVSSDIQDALSKLRNAMTAYDTAEEELLASSALPPTYSNNPDVVELFLFVRPVRQTAQTIEALMIQIKQMQQQNQGWKIYLPSYPYKKALGRTNATVRHDRGGVTAGFFFHSQGRLRKAMQGVSAAYKPVARSTKMPSPKSPDPGISRSETLGKYQEEEQQTSRGSNSGRMVKQEYRYKTWRVLHRLQGFETRFALKVVLVTSLLAVPAWLRQSRLWWNENESWWAVIFAWIMFHPRVGGNVQDLVTRALCAVMGAIWGGLAYGAYNGNPYVMATFALIYMIPMMYRFTQSSHPRSGIVGCLSFVIVSLGAKSNNGYPHIIQFAWTRGVAFLIGVVAAVLVNWFLWPFVARHELRKALSSMLVYSSIVYRGVVTKYVYYEKDEEPNEDDIAFSEMLEGRLREGFVRIRQLLALTRHEVRLRAPFDPLPHSALIASLEQFFEYLVSIRQSSLFFHPHYLPSTNVETQLAASSSTVAEALLPFRRDAVAHILMNLYALAAALRTGQKVPRYLPSAAAARRRLLQKMDEIEAEEIEAARRKTENDDVGESVEKVESVETEESKRKWSQIYAYSYSQSLTGCVKELESLELWTKQICGEQGFDPINLIDGDEDE